MKTWRDMKWKYENGRVYARVDNKRVIICFIPCGLGLEGASIGRAIAHVWNVDLAQTEWTRELFGDASAP